MRNSFYNHIVCMTDGFRGSPRWNADFMDADRLGDPVFLKTGPPFIFQA